MPPIVSDLDTLLEEISNFALATAEGWKVPGLAMSIVKDGQVVFSRGFGLRDVEGGLAVTPQTLLEIGSCTKAFTCTSLGILADEGRFDWDAPVRDYLPAFRLHDPVASERVTTRDLVTHRTGVPRHDMVWYSSARTREDLFARLRYLEPSKDLRTTWQYNNLMYLAAGCVVGQIVGKPWEDFTRERILDPLGMTASVFSVLDAQQSPDFALPYREKDGQIQRIPYFSPVSMAAIAPAGAIVSNVEDMAKWLLLQMSGGQSGGARIVSEAQLAATHTPQVVMPGPLMGIPVAFAYPELPPPACYALGWMVQSYRGHTLISHGGGIDGFTSQVAFLPQDKLGIVVLTNSGTPASSILSFGAIDRFLGLEPAPWDERAHQMVDQAKQAAAGSKEQAAENTAEAPRTHPLDAYVGDYEHPAYGTVSVMAEGDGLAARLNELSFRLDHLHYDYFEAADPRIESKTRVHFTTGPQGEIASFFAQLEVGVREIEFTRVPPESMLAADVLARLVGEYELAGMVITVALKDARTPTVTVPGQPTLELEPYRGAQYRIRNLPGFSVEFKLVESGEAAELTFHQPDGDHRATRKR